MYNLALKSSAGSGKTYELAKRFLSLYLRGFPLESLCGITFTNKATLEMKQRIIRYLDLLVLDNATRADEKEILKEFRKEQRFAPTKREYLMNNLSSLSISTFHSLFASFLSTLPFEAGILPGYEIISEAEEDILIEEVVDSFLETALRREKYKKVILDLILNDEKLVKENLIQVFKNIRGVLGLIRENLIEPQKIEEAIKIKEPEFKIAVDKFLLFIRENRECAYTAKGMMNKYMEDFIESIKQLTGDKNWIGTGEKLIMNNFLSKNYFRKFTDKLSDKESQFNTIVQSLVSSLKTLLSSLSDKELALHIKPILEIDRILHKEKLKQNLITFNDIEELTDGALRSGIEYLYFKIGANIDHLLIDEFQDTSIRQWEILKPLIDEITGWRRGEKSLFYVGDPNQAIFRWRGGEPRLFDFIKKTYKNKISEQTLDVNYRSKSVVVDFVNRLFGREDSSAMENQGGWVRFESVGSFKPTEGNEETRKRTIEIVKELKSIGYNDIAILVRTNKYGIAMADLLEQAGISCVSESKANLLSKNDTRIVINLLKFLECPEDDFSLASVLLSPFFGIPEDTVRRIKEKGKRIKDKGKRRQLSPRKKSLYLSLIDEHPDWDVSRKLQGLLKEVGFTTPYQMLYRIYKDLALPMTGSLAALLEAALSYTQKKQGTLTPFLNWIEKVGKDIEVEDIGKSACQAQGEGEVKILTVHKAKGLEFDVVIVPETGASPRAENRLLSYHYQEGNMQPDKIYWADVAKLFPELTEEGMDRVIEDEKKVLYVAITRAIKAVYILGFERKSKKSFDWFDFIKDKFSCPYKSGKIERREERVGVTLAVTQKVEREDEGYSVKEEREIYSPTDKGVELITGKREESMKLGDLVHKALSRLKWIDKKDPRDLARELSEYARSIYVRKAGDEKLIEEVEKIVYNTLTLKQFQFAFIKRDRDIKLKTEVPVYFKEKKGDVSARIDRLLIEPERITIIDYKTGEEKEDDIDQIMLYKKGMEKIFSGREIKGYLLYVEQGMVRE